jgi:hypothetical protein
MVIVNERGHGQQPVQLGLRQRRGGRRADALDEVRRGVPGQEGWVAQGRHEESPVRGDPAEVEPLEGEGQPHCRLGPRGTVGDHLCQHRVEFDADG